MDRCFTRAQKKHLYLAAGGKCESCGGELGDDWEAHHAKRYADGGVTSIQNGIALCKACHRLIHKGKKMSISPRGWQQEALDKMLTLKNKSFLIEATPGAGKTIFSALFAQDMINRGEVDFVVIVVPTTALKGDRDAGFLGDWNKVGVDLTTVIKSGKSAPRDFHGAVITYQQLDNIVGTFETWAATGRKLFFVFDEIHHASETNVWGAAANRCGTIAQKVLCMSGTPFRSDGRKISFVAYSQDGKAVPNFRYGYREAVADRVCREVLFVHDDGIAEYVLDDRINENKISESDKDNENKISATIFRKNSEWLEQVLIKAESKLDEYRVSDLDAGGIIICRPGIDEDLEDRYLHQIADLVAKITGDRPVVITHDDKEANAKIERFRKSSDRWICAVRKISEGVDIKRLKVMVMATKPSTELLFRQLVGRVVRVENSKKREDATVFMAGFPQLKEWAKQVSEEAQAGLRDESRRRKHKERLDGCDIGLSDFEPISSTHEHGGATASRGQQYSPDEVNRAESLKRDDIELADLPVSTIAYLLRKSGASSPDEPFVDKPKHERKKQKRKEINKLVGMLAYRFNPDKPDYPALWKKIHQSVGVKNLDDLTDNYDISKMTQVIELLKSWLQGNESHAA